MGMRPVSYLGYGIALDDLPEEITWEGEERRDLDAWVSEKSEGKIKYKSVGDSEQDNCILVIPSTLRSVDWDDTALRIDDMHGLIGSVSASDRDALLDFYREHLSPYAGYNTNISPSWLLSAKLSY